MREENFRRITCAQAKDYDMVDYLWQLGIGPVKTRGADYWYHSPFRQERTPSFKINRKMNRWFDFGEGEGGNLIDFGIRYHKCSVKEFLEMLSGGVFIFHQPASIAALPQEQKIIILEQYPLRSAALVDYLKQRCIPTDIAEPYCCEVRYQSGKRIYYAIGFKNDAGGFELRNKYFKGSSLPKDVTLIRNGAQELAAFEGFFDFLSYLVIMEQKPVMDFLIFNSTSLFNRALGIMEQYIRIHLYLDNDGTGRKHLKQAMEMGARYVDESSLYQNYKDLNDMLNDRPQQEGLI